MTIPFSDLVTTTLLGGLRQLDALLDAVAEREDAADLLEARLAEDMFTFAQQVQAATDNARRVVDRLVGDEPSSRPDPELTVEGLEARVAETLRHVEAADAAAIDASSDRAMTVNLGAGPMELTGRSMVLGFTLPNFLFHVTTAYGILRHRGLPLGKRGYITPFMMAAQRG